MINKEILLIDDIFTTGSTVDACAEVLLEAGAAKVFVFTFASGANLMKEEEEKGGQEETDFAG